MNNDTNPRASTPDPEKNKPSSGEQTKEDQQRSDPPLTEIKGVTDPEEYVEPKVEEEPEK